MRWPWQRETRSTTSYTDLVLAGLTAEVEGTASDGLLAGIETAASLWERSFAAGKSTVLTPAQLGMIGRALLTGGEKCLVEEPCLRSVAGGAMGRPRQVCFPVPVGLQADHEWTRRQHHQNGKCEPGLPRKDRSQAQPALGWTITPGCIQGDSGGAQAGRAIRTCGAQWSSWAIGSFVNSNRRRPKQSHSQTGRGRGLGRSLRDGPCCRRHHGQSFMGAKAAGTRTERGHPDGAQRLGAKLTDGCWCTAGHGVAKRNRQRITRGTAPISLVDDRAGDRASQRRIGAAGPGPQD